MIDRLPKQDTPYYDTADDIIAENDLIEADIRVAGWDHGKFRIRALTFGQISKINRNATARKKDEERGIEIGDFLNDEWAYWTIVEGVVRPRFKIEQARRLADSNGEFVKELADEIWNLGRLSKTLWDKFLAEIDTANKIAAGKTDEVADERTT